MMVQILLDWEGLFRGVAAGGEERLCVALLRLAEYVRRNGCVVESQGVQKALMGCASAASANLSSVITVWSDVYKDYALQVDGDREACTLADTITAWQRYLRDAGVLAQRGDGRFVLVGGDGAVAKGAFYLKFSIGRFLDPASVAREIPGLDLWTRMQHFGKGCGLPFENYLQAFCACAKPCVRLYDPYLSEMFLPVAREPRRKAWRNSFQLLYAAFAKNEHVRRIEVVTAISRDCDDYLHGDQNHRLRMDEILCDIVIPAFKARRADLTVSFHVLREKSVDFHDRFVVNGRLCFAIGHGLDICREGKDFKRLNALARDGGPVSDRQWRTPLDHEFEELSEFNVFYGCTCKSVPDGVTLFAEGSSGGRPKIYPHGCDARCDADFLRCFSLGSACRAADRGSAFSYDNPGRGTTLTILLNDGVGKDEF